MQWPKRNITLPEYEFTNTNQHGDRFKRKSYKHVSVVMLATDCTNIPDMQTLILLSHHLNAPVHYDFDTDPHVAYIEIVAKESIQ